jgi:hypothetical protein
MTTEKIAEVLQQIDIPVSPNTVARLLYQMDFSLRVNRKQIATNSSPYRDQQFQHISKMRTRFQRKGLPVISVDSKKRELIGNFKNSGAKWDRSPVLVNDHDFRSDASGVGISYGIYDPPNNRGTVCVGVSHDTAAFAAHSIVTWWNMRGLVSMAPRPNSSFLPTRAAATIAAPGPGKQNSRTNCATRLASPSPSLTTLLALPNGIPSSIACSPRYPRTGLGNHLSAMKRCSDSFAAPAQKLA